MNKISPCGRNDIECKGLQTISILNRSILMKYTALFIIIAFSAASCSSPASNNGGTDTAIKGDTLAKSTPTTNNTPTTIAICFERGEGKNNVDSTYVQLVVKGNTVTGEMNWLPFEKDARKGLLSGTQKGDTIRAVWTFKQEGMTDSIKVAFKLDGNNLAQKPFKTDTKTGRQLTDESAGYTINYKPSQGQRP